jgi:hypothetical protein
MDLKIHRPKGYMTGAWKVEAVLSVEEVKDYDICPIAFEIPTLAHRNIHTLTDYVVAVSDLNGTKLRGRFLNGKWESHVYSNGIEESKNPTSIEYVEERIRASIENSLEKIKGLSLQFT